jgi:hypothetical protein
LSSPVSRYNDTRKKEIRSLLESKQRLIVDPLIEDIRKDREKQRTQTVYLTPEEREYQLRQ